ncbi:hypothetical protein FDB34_15905 [Clostridium botulinum]|uniref:hypothetical protein n=1 Tax=Clostridium botulinum TaxID=1491 RepID=UPI0013F74A7F|nr:hypothetical protein [Clostridium botulinum]MBN1065390.1 hypothetical protein [Clostridium botulinum]NFO15639.1 hypothetical protein [Clostridium botulinum]
MFEMYKGEELGVCGAVEFYGMCIALYVRPSTGEVLYKDWLNNSSYKVIENLILKDAITVIDAQLVYENLVRNKYGLFTIGVIFCSEYAIVINSPHSIQKRTLNKISEDTGKYEFIFMDI